MTSADSVSIKKLALISVGLIALALATYGAGVTYGFVFDDLKTIVHNPGLERGTAWADLFSDRYYIHSGESTYRPLVTASYILEHSLFGKTPGGFHLTNIILHSLNSAMFFLFAFMIFHNLGWAAFSAAIFAVHPAASEAVNGISFREDLLMASFAFVTLFAGARFLAAERASRWAWLALSAVALFASCLSKESGVVVPAILAAGIMANLIGKPNSRFRRSFPLFLALLLVCVLYLFIWAVWMKNPASKHPALLGGNWFTVFLNIPLVYLHHIKTLLWPFNLSAQYTFQPATSLGLHSALAAFALVALLAFTTWLLLKKSIMGFGLCWLIIALAPVSNIMPLFNPVADRYLYFPLAGFALFAAAGLQFGGRTLMMRNREISRQTVQVISITIIGALFLTTILAANPRWSSDENLWLDTLNKNPKSHFALYRLGDLARERAEQHDPNTVRGREMRKRELDQAETYLAQAVKLAPKFADPLNCLGIIHFMRGEMDEAMDIFQQVLLLDPNHASAIINLAQVNAVKDPPDFQLALSYLDQAKSLEFPVPQAFEQFIRDGAANSDSSQD